MVSVFTSVYVNTETILRFFNNNQCHFEKKTLFFHRSKLLTKGKKDKLWRMSFEVSTDTKTTTFLKSS